MFALNPKAAADLSRQMTAGKIKKTYLAVTEGTVKVKSAKLVDWLKKDGRTNSSAVVEGGTSGAKKAILSYEVLKTWKNKEDKNSFVFILLGKVTHLFVSLSDFGLMPTLTVCVIQNGRTPLLLLQLLLLILPADETTVYTVCNLYFYLLSLLANLFLSPVLQAIAICLTSATIFDQYSMLFTLIMFNFIDNSM